MEEKERCQVGTRQKQIVRTYLRTRQVLSVENNKFKELESARELEHGTLLTELVGLKARLTEILQSAKEDSKNEAADLDEAAEDEGVRGGSDQLKSSDQLKGERYALETAFEDKPKATIENAAVNTSVSQPNAKCCIEHRLTFYK